MSLTPLHLEIVMHYATRGDDMPNIDASTTDEFAQRLCREGMIEPNPCGAAPGGPLPKRYRTTEKGRVWLEHILRTPFPVKVERWEVP